MYRTVGFGSEEFVPECEINYRIYIYLRRLTTGIRSGKSVGRRFRHCANVIQCTYTNLDSTV
jgi:hypothetical protein